MCGLFGMIRARAWTESRCQLAAEALVMLGALSEERGQDAAGLAMRGAVTTSSDAGARADVARFRDAHVGDWRVVKVRDRFTQLDIPTVVDDLLAARVVLGHTRWSTQGGDLLVNASPLVIGSLIGTHNGDIDVRSVRALVSDQVRITGDTDTAVLFAALASVTETAAAQRAVLAKALGRVALAWVDRRLPHGLWLARGALSPLAVATDDEGGMWWASNPEWLRRVERTFHLGLTPPRMVLEGTLMRVRPRNGELKVVRATSFRPLARAADLRIASVAAWRGFTASDRADDKDRLIHKLVTPTRVPAQKNRHAWFADEPIDAGKWPLPTEPWDDPRWNDSDWRDADWSVA